MSFLRLTFLCTAACTTALATGAIAQTVDTPHAAAEAAAPQNPLKDAYFGEIHIHTGVSMDAFILSLIHI